MSDLREQLQKTLGDAYRVERELGGGGMSRVFVAQEIALGRAVVVKVLHPEMAAAVSIERFRREIRVSAQLQHPHIVPVLAAGETDGLPYFTMPYVEGRSLRAELTSGGPLPIRTTTLLLREVASALAYSHSHAVVHRDIKPENILISGGSAMVTDFGVAKALAASTLHKGDGLTSAGVALGTPAYMAPEQITADQATDARADIYAFGVVAYEMLTGSPPFAGSPQSLIAAHLTMQPESIDRRRSDIPPALAALVMRCLEKRAADRPQSAAEIADSLGKILTGENLAPPARPRHSDRRRIAAVIAAVALIVIALAFAERSRGIANTATTSGAKSVAVMPFVNLSSASGDEYFSDGMTEELIDALSKLPALKVAARSSVFALRQRNLTPRDVGKELGVTSVVEGTVRRSGDRLRISAQLVDASTGYSLWADSYDRDARDVFAIQDDISRAIVGALKVRLSGQQATLVEAPTENVEAHNLVLQGRFFTLKRTAPDIRHAITLFSQAIALDSTYARAYAELSNAYALLPAYAEVSAAEVYPKALAAAQRALALDSTLGDAHTALGMTEYRFGWNQDLARRELEKGIALEPTNALGRTVYAQQLDFEGKTDSAIVEARAALRAEPLSLITNTMTGVAYYNARRFREAEAVERNAIELDSTFVRSHRDLGWALLAQNRFSEAEHEFEIARRLAHDTPGTETAYLYAVSGRRAAAEALARALESADSAGRLSNRPRYGWETAIPLEMAMVYGVLGNRDRAFYWLDRAYSERILPMYIRTSPQFDSLRADPRFANFIARLSHVDGRGPAE
jgi:serine/threonine protein kinase/tetratricopeptide (TPR) repeat protein